MVDFAHFLLKKATCCICSKTLNGSKHLNLAILDKKATWKSPVWMSSLDHQVRAVAVVCDGCHNENPGFVEIVKYAIEVREDEIMLHNVDELENVEPINILPDFNTGSMKDVKYMPFIGYN